MATQVQFRRGSKPENDAFKGAVGEVTVDTTKQTLRVHDASKLGGYPLLRDDGTNSELDESKYATLVANHSSFKNKSQQKSQLFVGLFSDFSFFYINS